MVTVSADHNKLSFLGNILLQYNETKLIAQDLLKDYGKNGLTQLEIMIISGEIFTHCPDTASSSQIMSSIPLSGVPHVEPNSSSINYASFPVLNAARGMEFLLFINNSIIIITLNAIIISIVEVPVKKNIDVSSARVSFARMLYKVSKAIIRKSPPLEELKSLILSCNNDLKDKLDDCSSVSSVMYLIKEERDIELLQIVVKELEVREAERYIEQYKATIEEVHYCMY